MNILRKRSSTLCHKRIDLGKHFVYFNNRLMAEISYTDTVAFLTEQLKFLFAFDFFVTACYRGEPPLSPYLLL